MRDINQIITVPILLVDDRPENLLSLDSLLSDQGYELVKAASGNEALRLTLKQDFALVLMDVQMPQMDGFETAELMRSNPKTRHIPIIFVTAGMKDTRFQFKGYDSGAVDYLAKPIEPMFLRSKVKIFAELYRQRRDIELHKNHLEELVALRTIELIKSADDLKISNELLKNRNTELLATEELLRAQVIEFVETHDQLLATEEMLRIQLDEYQTAQKLLNESNTSLKTLFDVSPLAIVVASFPEGIIRKINNTFCVDFKYTKETVIGQNGVELGLWIDNFEWEIFLKEIRDNHEAFGFEADIRTREGEVRKTLLYSNLMDFNNEKCLLILFLDVTEQKRMEDQIRQTQKMDVIGQLAGGVAHDFNNMLTAILGSAELMARHVANNASAEKLLRSIQQAASRSAELTGQLLAFSRKGQKNLVQVQIDKMIQEVITLLERTIDKKIRLEMRSDAGTSLIIGDPTLLQNALLNLGVNARDAMPEGGVITFATASVNLDAAYCETVPFDIKPGHYLEISVSDNGVGMTKEVARRVFEPFFTTKEVGKGTGLGLAAVYGTIIEHHGCINIQSEPGVGTVFRLYIPLSLEEFIETPAPEELTQGAGGVLLVDDEEILREVGQSLLEDLGYRVYLAENGEEALEVYALKAQNIDLVILDMLMPKMGGKEALMHLKAAYPDIRVLILSGYHQVGTAAELEKMGAVGFLQKPYKRQELCKAVLEALAR